MSNHYSNTSYSINTSGFETKGFDTKVANNGDMKSLNSISLCGSAKGFQYGMAKSFQNNFVSTMAKGFTIIELLVAVSIVALLVSLALPNFSEAIQNNRLATKANDLMLGLKVARQTAISRGLVTFICHSNNTDTDKPTCGGGTDSDWNTGFIVYTAPIRTLTPANRDYAPDTDSLIQQISLSQSKNIEVKQTNAEKYISFTSGGLLFDSDAIEMQICDDRTDENGHLIRVSLSGKINRESKIGKDSVCKT